MPAFLIALAAAGAAVALVFLLRRYAREREESARVRELFSRYVPQHVVDELLEHRRDGHALWAQRHYATVVCARVRSFGLFAEELSAEETLRHLNEFYAVAGRAIVRHGGVIERLNSDGITAVFGVLTAERFHEERALRAALRIARLAHSMDKRWQAQGRRPFAVALGVNSGDVVAGEVGFAQRREFAIVGNAAHIAARLQIAAETLNASVLASSATYEVVADLFTAVPVQSLPLSGLKRLHTAYIVRGVAQRADEEQLQLPADIPALETIVETPPRPDFAPRRQLPPATPRFSQYDDLLAALPEAPVISGEYEPPAG